MRLRLLALTLILSAGPGSAQSAGRLPPVIGPLGGLNFATFGGQDADDAGGILGFQAGLFGRFALNRHFALAPALVFTRQGAEADGTDFIVGGAIKLSYLELPLMLQFGIPLSQRSRVYLESGPAVAYKLGCTRDVGQGDAALGYNCDYTLINTRRTEFSAHFGGGLEFSQFFVGARYRLGLSSIDASDDQLDIKNRGLALMAGYGFRVGH